MKVEPIESSETSASNTQTPGNYLKESELHFVYVYKSPYPQILLQYILNTLFTQFI
jgi:hypothetical protein